MKRLLIAGLCLAFALATTTCVDRRIVPALEVLTSEFITPNGRFVIKRLVPLDDPRNDLRLHGESPGFWLSFRVVSDNNRLSLLPKDRSVESSMTYAQISCTYQRGGEKEQRMPCSSEERQHANDRIVTSLTYELPTVLRVIDLGNSFRLPAEAAEQLQSIDDVTHRLRFAWQSNNGPYRVDVAFKVGTDNDWTLDLPIPTGGLP